jgi:hypothetical protein
MMQQFMLVVVFVVCLSSKAQRAFVSADDDGMETTTFGECFDGMIKGAGHYLLLKFYFLIVIFFKK